ncbi:MAG: hypothetical protein KHX55_05605 [Proteobacteria bacterium]|nr:hypothetical protein [Pseudomonadota bacterium]
MKKIFYICGAVLLLLTACGKGTDSQNSELNPNKVYFFYSNSCPHCHDALDYINQKYPDLKISMVNVGTGEGYEMLVRCARKFKLGSQIGTPLFCMGDKHLMGWAPSIAEQFDRYVKPFLK